MKQTRERSFTQEVKALYAREALKRGKNQHVDALFEHVQATPPKQARSLETVSRLLNAAEQLLEEGGLEAATVPAIAAKAGVSVGVVYRRFVDKDTLLRAVWQRYLAQKREQTASILDACMAMHIPLPELLRGMIRGTLDSYRRRRNLLRALLQFSRTHPDPAFRRAAHEINRTSTAAVAMLMMRYRDQIAHPNVEVAIEFMMITLASILQTVVLEAEQPHGLRAPADLEAELTRMMFGYLGIEE
ncbi:MAG: TetR/AcrR family transcriptional regulator [Acidobacteria bacterium]|nr:TetR/AcrR family transcriptional regulator [Acidobacteriota bacterium]MBV9475579.1 TetR/AcrR family transcriptional regulator [Acidobacteriota bacterium]